MGLEKGQLTVLIQGIGLEIQPGGVNVRRHDLGAFLQALPTQHRQHDALVPVYPVDLVAALELHAPLIGPEARLPGQLHGLLGALPLGLALLQKGLIQAAVALHSRQFLRLDAVIAVLAPGEQFLPQGLSFLTHGQIPPVSIL